MADYHFVLVHKPGNQNRADALSRRPDYDTGERDNDNIVVLPDHLFANTMELLSIEQQVFEAQSEHEEQMNNLSKDFALDTIEGKRFYRGRIVVPENDELKQQILRQYHDHQLAGHPGIA